MRLRPCQLRRQGYTLTKSHLHGLLYKLQQLGVVIPDADLSHHSLSLIRAVCPATNQLLKCMPLQTQTQANQTTVCRHCKNGSPSPHCTGRHVASSQPVGWDSVPFLPARHQWGQEPRLGRGHWHHLHSIQCAGRVWQLVVPQGPDPAPASSQHKCLQLIETASLLIKVWIVGVRYTMIQFWSHYMGVLSRRSAAFSTHAMMHYVYAINLCMFPSFGYVVMETASRFMIETCLAHVGRAQRAPM